MKRNLNNRLKKVERELNSRENKENKKVLIVVKENDPGSEYGKLIQREKNGEEIDWDKYDFTKCGELPEEEINDLYERTKGY